MSARKQNFVTIVRSRGTVEGAASISPQNPVWQLTEGKKRKTANPNGIFSSDVSLSEKSETTPDSRTSTGKKLKMEQPEEVQELQSPLGNIFTPSCIRKDLESDDKVPIKELRLKLELINNFISSSPRIRPAVWKKTKLLTELKDCHSKISTVKRSNTCERKTKGRVTDKKQHTPVKSVTSDILLPFEKTSPVWKTLETTLEVFRQIPQTPHFMKLEREHKDKREGVAFGLMMTYSILSDSIQRLLIHTEAKVFEEKIACLESLEDDGFIVDPIRSRLQQLIDMKKDHTESSLKGVELKTELASEEKKSMSLHASANVHETELEDVRKRITELREREKAIMDEKARKLGLLAKLEHNKSRLRENILSIDRSSELAPEEFKRLISKPLGEEGI